MLTSDVKPGAFVSFTYIPPRGSEEPAKEIMVLNPNWEGKVHGIDLRRVTPAERMVLQMIMDPETKQRLETVPYPLVRDVLRRMDPVEVVKSPQRFYQQFVKPFCRNKDVYRKYWPQFMQGIKVVKPSEIQGPMRPVTPTGTAFKPMFKNPLFKGSPFKK